MNDKELLILAAKAERHGVEFDEASGLAYYDDRFTSLLWNPLHNDGDALRLAVKLGMEIYIDNHPEGCSCSEAQSHMKPNCARAIYNHTQQQDQFAATRRAIVHAAADIGRGML